MILFDDHEPESDSQSTANRPAEEEAALLTPARIKVFGVGGGGGSAVSRMVDARLRGIECIAATTDLHAVRTNRAPTKTQPGPALTRRPGAGGDPPCGRKAALEDTDQTPHLPEGADTVFLTAGLGRGTGTGAVPIIASLA